MSDATLVTDEEHNYSLRVPNTTPSGQPVEITRHQQAGTHQVHAHSPDASTVYFELVSFAQHIDHAKAVAGQKDFLASRAPDASLTATQQRVVHTWAATEFRFVGTLDSQWKVRCFLFLDSSVRTYRIVYDPRSALNEQILDSLEIH